MIRTVNMTDTSMLNTRMDLKGTHSDMHEIITLDDPPVVDNRLVQAKFKPVSKSKSKKKKKVRKHTIEDMFSGIQWYNYIINV